MIFDVGLAAHSATAHHASMLHPPVIHGRTDDKEDPAMAALRARMEKAMTGHIRKRRPPEA